MPVMDGTTAIRSLQRTHPRIKVIAASGFTGEGDHAISAGAHLFLAKPYSATQLLTALRDVLGN